jgi:hypothetical protein
MPDFGSPSDRWPPIHFYRDSLVSIICFVVSAASFVSAVFLFAYCIPVTMNGNSVCVYPHWLAASFFVLGGGLFSVLGIVYGALAWLSLEPERYRRLLAVWHERTVDWHERSLESAQPSEPDVSGPMRPP